MDSPAYLLAVGLVLGIATPLAHARFRRQGWPARPRWILLVLVGGLLVGTVSHVFDVIRAGSEPYADQPRLFNLFWTALVVLDPVGAWLLVHRTKVGLLLLTGIMLVDIAVNVLAFGDRGIVSPPNAPLLFQIGFGLFTFLSVPVLFRRANETQSSSASSGGPSV
ncbi:MAG: hypothetical protein AB8I08_13535 [Sandaracinaceae bacterium]